MTDKMQAWQEQQDRTQALGHDTINRVITDLRKLADGLEHYRDILVGTDSGIEKARTEQRWKEVAKSWEKWFAEQRKQA